MEQQQTEQKKAFQIGHYRITKTLGQGTFGKVKEGVHILTGQKVAIKLLDKSKITDVNDVERVSREIHILKVVRHPHIIQLYETIETPNRLFLIMEHCCNGELFSFITSKNKLKEEEACKLFQQLISALTYLGKLGIVHRDVKPENLLLDQQLNLKMIDFGLSNMYKPGEKLATACGSPCYAAPELIKGLEYLGPKADLWSAGVVLYTMVCGHLPFEDSNTQSLYQKILNARYKFTCYLSQEIQSLIQNILVPDPELRYGLKQVTSNTWYKKTYQAKELAQDGIEVGIDQIRIFDNVVKEVAQSQDPPSDPRHVRLCLQAHTHNETTAFYYLLLKKKIVQGEPLDNMEAPNQALLMPQERQTKRYQSIEPVRTTLYNEKNKYQLRKIAEGLNDFNIARVNNTSDIATAAPTNNNPASQITSPQATRVQQQQLQNQLLLMSPDQMIFSPTQLDSHGLISPTLVAFDNHEKLQLQVQKAYQEHRKAQLPQGQQLFNNKNTLSSAKKDGKRNLQTITAMTALADNSPLLNNSAKQPGTRNNQKRFLNKTIEPTATTSQGSSQLGQFDLLTPNMPAQKLMNKGGSTFEIFNNDYANLQPNSLFSNREERKTTRFKKNNPSGDRGYGKQKYSSQKGSLVSSNENSATNAGGKPGVMPHSLLEKEIRHIMNQSQLVQSTKDKDISFNQGSNLRRIANQRLSVMSNYDTGNNNLGLATLGSQQLFNQNQLGSQMIRQGKMKARQVNSIKDGFKTGEKKDGTNGSFSVKKPNQQPKMIAQSIQDGKINLPKPSLNQNHVRKASVGVISPTQQGEPFFENKLVFSGSQLVAFQNETGMKPPTIKEKLNTTQPVKKQTASVQKQPSSNKKHQNAPKVTVNRVQPATGESQEVTQYVSEPNKSQMKNKNMTQQLSGLFQQLNSNKQVNTNQMVVPQGIISLNPSQITSPHNVNQAVLSQFSGGPMSMIQSPHQAAKQTPQSIKQQLNDFQNMQLNQTMMLGMNPTSNFNSNHVQKRNTGAKTAFNTVQMPPGQQKKPSTTERQGSQPASTKAATNRQRADSKRNTTTNSYYDSLLRFQQSELNSVGHHRAVTSVGMNAKFNPKAGGGNWQQVNSVRVTNHSQPAKQQAASGLKKGNSASRNQKGGVNSSFASYGGGGGNGSGANHQNQGKVVQGGVTNFNVFQHIQNLNQTTIMSPDSVARTPQEFKQQIRQKRSYGASAAQNQP